MFCYQCEQTAKGTGCTVSGVCGKEPQVAALQDLLVHAAKGIAQYGSRLAKMNDSDNEIDNFILEALFSTVTNVNFDTKRLKSILKRAGTTRDKAWKIYEKAIRGDGKTATPLTGPAAWTPANDTSGMVAQGKQESIEARKEKFGEELVGLQELIIYGLKGAAAYADHAAVLGKRDPQIMADFHHILCALAEEEPTQNRLLELALKTGELNFRVMKLLDEANTGTYGHPEPTTVRVTPKKGKCILVSGHDLKDLELILQATDGKEINIYTHGEMLPCLAYPELKKYPHLAGNYGGAWQDQQKEFEAFPGPIVMTTNCIQKPRDSYKDRIFTTGLVAWPDVKHIGPSKHFDAVVEAALAAPGFTEDEPEKTITVGFARNTVMSVANQVIAGVKSGAIKHFFLVGGCDGAKPGRNYYTDFAKQVPDNCVILTLACGKYRFNKLDFGDIGGIPRLLDIGQCNDAYSAIEIALALADAFQCGVNDLPLSLILSWYEQKAVAILLTLLHLGVKNIRIGPSLPAFVSPKVLEILVEKFNIAPVTTPEEDLKAILG